MKKEEFLNLPNGTKFMMKANCVTPLTVWEFIDMSTISRTNEDCISNNQKYAKAGEWHKVGRKIRNTANNHECWISACQISEYIDEKTWWRTKKMHLIK